MVSSWMVGDLTMCLTSIMATSAGRRMGHLLRFRRFHDWSRRGISSYQYRVMFMSQSLISGLRHGTRAFWGGECNGGLLGTNLVLSVYERSMIRHLYD